MVWISAGGGIAPHRGFLPQRGSGRWKPNGVGRGWRTGFQARPIATARSIDCAVLSHVNSDHDALDLVDGHRGRRPVVELRRLRRRVPRGLLRVLEGAAAPAAVARRLIIARTTRRSSARPVSRRLAGSTLWNRTACGSSSPAASRYSARAAAARWWAGTSCRRPRLLLEPEPPPVPLPEVVLRRIPRTALTRPKL